jgi:hypothetical protein
VSALLKAAREDTKRGACSFGRDITVSLLKEYRKHWLAMRLKLGDKWRIDKDVLFLDRMERLSALMQVQPGSNAF